MISTLYVFLKLKLPMRLFWKYKHIEVSFHDDVCSEIRWDFLRDHATIRVGNLGCKRTSFLHELGHYIHYKSVSIPTLKRTHTKKREKLAWRYAIELAQKYRIDFDYKHAEYCLSTYGYKSRHIEKRLLTES